MWFEPFAIVLAMLPLAAYLLLLGGVRLLARPLVTTGGRDLAALAMGMVGLFAIGPLELFFPGAAAVTLGPYVWLCLLLFYILSVTLIILSTQPRLIIYGATSPEILEPLLRTAKRLDNQAELHSAQRQICMPNLGIRLRVDGHRQFDTSQVVAFEPDLTPAFWKQLLSGLRHELKETPSPQRFSGVGMLVFGLLFLSIVVGLVVLQPTRVTSGFSEWLWR